jgi:hypothetical protein
MRVIALEGYLSNVFIRSTNDCQQPALQKHNTQTHLRKKRRISVHNGITSSLDKVVPHFFLSRCPDLRRSHLRLRECMRETQGQAKTRVGDVLVE